MTRLSAIAIAATLFGSPMTASAQEDDTDATMRAYSACLQRAAAQMDDQKSDASTIAGAIVTMCPQEYAAQKAAWGRRFSNPAATQMFYDKMDAAQVQMATAVVLKERRDRANSNQKLP